MIGIQNPSVRPYQYPYSRVTIGSRQPIIPSPSHPVFSPGHEGASDAQHWTPHGIFRAITRVWQGRVGGQLSRAQAHAQVPALWQIVGVPNGYLTGFQVKPAAGRPGTPPVRHISTPPLFPQMFPPTPSYPLPGAARGRL
jgi:hypothetical protein